MGGGLSEKCGRYTYTSDQRFSAHHIPLTHFWQLRIRAVTPRDEGFYECQVSTTPPRGHRIELRVVGERIQRHFFGLEPVVVKPRKNMTRT